MTRQGQRSTWRSRVGVVMRRGVREVLALVAALWHRLHPGATRIGITGSCGKTSTKEMTQRLLASRLPGVCTPRSLNGFFSVFLTVLRIRRRHRYALFEIATGGPGTLDAVLPLARLRIGVVLNVSTDHYKGFGSIEGVAAEKRRLVEVLPPDGTAILNADDPAVRAMATHTRARVVWIGLASDAQIRAEQITCGWPAPLRFTVVDGDERAAVEIDAGSPLFVPNALAAIAVGRTMGLSLADCAQGLAGAGAYMGRLDARRLPDGVTFLCDYWKASLGSLPLAFDTLARCSAARRIAVIGTLSDYPGAGGDRYRKVARELLGFCDVVLFVGAMASSVDKLRPPEGRVLCSFEDIADARAYLRDTVRAGDVVLLKGSGKIDHFERLVLAHQGPVACWRLRCGRKVNCHECRLLQRPERRRR